MKKIHVIILFPVLFMACHKSPSKNTKAELIHELTVNAPVTFKKIQSIEISDALYNVLAVSNDRVYVTGYSEKTKTYKKIIQVFDYDLALLKRVEFNLGQGPGDLGGGTQLFFSKDHILGPDNVQDRINIFDHNLNFLKSVKLKTQYSPLTFFKNGEYFFAPHYFQSSKMNGHFNVHIISFPDMRIQFSVEIPGTPYLRNEKKRFIIGDDPTFHYGYSNGKIYFLFNHSYTITMMDLNGNIAKKIRVRTNVLKVPKEKKSKWLQEIVGQQLENRFHLAENINPSSKMIILQKGFAVIRRKSYTKECSGRIDADYFTFTLEMKGKVKFPCFSRYNERMLGYNWRSIRYKNGYLFLTTESDEKFFLEKWQVDEKRENG